MEGLNAKRMIISLVLAAFFGFFCAYGTSMVEIPGFEVTMGYLATVFYARLMIGFVIGLSGGLVLVKGAMRNAALRGAVMGAVMSVIIGLYGGMEVFVAAGIVYGIVTDVVATKLTSKS